MVYCYLSIRVSFLVVYLVLKMGELKILRQISVWKWKSYAQWALNVLVRGSSFYVIGNFVPICLLYLIRFLSSFYMCVITTFNSTIPWRFHSKQDVICYCTLIISLTIECDNTKKNHPSLKTWPPWWATKTKPASKSMASSEVQTTLMLTQYNGYYFQVRPLNDFLIKYYVQNLTRKKNSLLPCLSNSLTTSSLPNSAASWRALPDSHYK